MITTKEQNILTVTQLTRAIKTNLENEYRFVRISGEISNLKTPYSGHSYFTLKDENAQLRAVLFKQQKRFVALRMEDGQQVVCFGRITVYEPRGDYQLIVDSVELYGKGRLQQEFEALKQKLSARGYFDESIKKELPPFASKIAVVTSPTGAALQDFLKIVKTRRSPLQVVIVPTLVQGKEAPPAIATAIKRAQSIAGIEAIVLCRGGGSLEDLWAFNDEAVADAIYQCKIPLLTGIGHEVDFTIADFCADLRAATPTAAAEILTSDTVELLQGITSLKNRLRRSMLTKLSVAARELHHNTKLLGTFRISLAAGEHRLTMSKSYLIQAMADYLQNLSNKLQVHQTKLAGQAPLAKIEMQEKHLDHLKRELIGHMKQKLQRCEAELGSKAALLNSVSPLATLGRGYSIVRKKKEDGKPGTVVTDSGQVDPGDAVNILLHKGNMDCIVESTGE